MRPLKPKDFIASTALEHDLPPEVVSEIIDEYWKDVRSTLSSLEHNMVCVHTPGPRSEKRRTYMEIKLRAIEAIVERRKDEAQRKDFIKQHKNDRANIQK